MIWTPLLGHARQRELFRRAVKRERLAQAYVFVGSSGIGKRYFARLLAQCLFCEQVADEELDACGECSSCRQMQAGTHPDLLTVGLPEGKREIPIALIAGERDQRGRAGLCHDISLAPMSAPRRVAIIDEAQAMNEESTNALLKTLEEPPDRSMMILIATDEELLLPTIRSRCQPVRFNPLSAEHVAQLLGELTATVDDQHLRHVLEIAGGSPDVARRLLEPDLAQLWKAVEAGLAAPQFRPAEALHSVHAALESIGGDTAAQREGLQWTLTFAIESLRQRLRMIDDPLASDRCGMLLDRCFEANHHLQQNMSVPLCLDALYAELGRRQRV